MLHRKGIDEAHASASVQQLGNSERQEYASIAASVLIPPPGTAEECPSQIPLHFHRTSCELCSHSCDGAEQLPGTAGRFSSHICLMLHDGLARM